MYCSFPINVHSLPRCAFFSTNSYHCRFVNGLSPFACRDLLKHCWHKLVVYDSSPSFYHHRRKLPDAEGLFAAVIVTTKQRLLRNADRARYETCFFNFLLIHVICFSYAVVCFFGFQPNFLPFRALDFFTFFPWRSAFPSGTFPPALRSW